MHVLWRPPIFQLLPIKPTGIMEFVENGLKRSSDCKLYKVGYVIMPFEMLKSPPYH